MWRKGKGNPLNLLPFSHNPQVIELKISKITVIIRREPVVFNKTPPSGDLSSQYRPYFYFACFIFAAFVLIVFVDVARTLLREKREKYMQKHSAWQVVNAKTGESTIIFDKEEK